MADRTRPDDFEQPVPHKAPGKSVVDSVLSSFIAAGNGVVTLLAGLLAGVLVLYSGYVIYDSFATEYRAYSSSWDLMQYKPEIAGEDDVPMAGASLEEINQDYRAWITVYDTNIDYPVMQGKDDLYYAAHDIYKQSSLTGAIYLAAANDGALEDSYNLLYGHHMDNGAMFGGLDRFKEKAYFNAHKSAVIVGKSGVYDIEFFAVAETDAYESRIYSVGDRKDDVISFLRSGGLDGVGVGTNVLYFNETVANRTNKVIALSTCASATTSGRLVLFGRMIPRKAEPTPTVEPKPTHGPKPTKAPHNVPTQKPAATTYTLTVRYVDENGNELFAARTFTFPQGKEYYVESPTRAGYTASRRAVTGVMDSDTEITVVYTRGTYTLTVRYVALDGTELRESYVMAYSAGDSYSVAVPKIPGYQASRNSAEGVMGGYDMTVTVLYVPEDETIIIDEYGAPLNMGGYNMQIGVCIE